MQLLRIFFFVFIIIPCFCLAQNSGTENVDSIAASLITKLRQTDKDRIFLQTDKKVYAEGETVWFKVFIVDSINNRVTYKNRIVYVDLVNDKDSVISLLLLHANRANVTGSISLDSSMQGYYRLRAYTKKMIEENIKNVGLQVLYVVNNKIKNNLSETQETYKSSSVVGTKPVVEIFPEGGWLISGANSVVAVKVHDQNGNPLMVPGVVKDNRDTVIARFNTNDNGLAKFSFSPAWFGKYKVYILNKDKFDSVGMLPRVNPYAAQLSVEEQNEQSVKVRVMLEDSVYTPGYTTYILGISRDSLCFAGIGRGMYELNIPVSNFPDGVAKLLLFNAKKELVSERNIYLNKKNASITITPDKQNYGPGENVKLDMNVADGNGKPLPATLSISVVDARIADATNHFNSDKLDAVSAEEADLIMLAQKNELQELLSAGKKRNDSTKYNDSTLMIKGKVINRKKEPVPGHEVTLMSNKENLFVQQDTTNDKGNFEFHVPDFNDGAQFSLQVNTKNQTKDNFNVVLEDTKPPHFSTPDLVDEKFSGKQFFKKEINFIDSISTVRDGFLLPVSVKGYTSDDNRQKRNNISSTVITNEMLSESGVNSVGEAVMRSGKFHLVGGYLMSGGPNGMGGPSATDEPMIILDGVQIQPSGGDAAELSPVLAFLKTLSANEIDYIKLLTGNEATIYGVRGGHDVIEIHTTNKMKSSDAASDLKTFYPKGFYVAQPFNMPDYSKREVRNSKNPDLRTTIYWDGDIIADKDGKASVNFFTADPPATYVVTVTGITANGDKIYKTITLSRK